MIVTKVLPNIHARTNGVLPTFDKVVNELFRDFGAPATYAQLPAINIAENNDGYRLELAAPGLNKEDFGLEIKDNQLIISANKTTEQTEGETMRRREFGYFQFTRQFQLPKTVDQDAIEARYEAGVLYINLPKRPEARPQEPRKLEIG
jgi:HSP20 family protein